MLIADFTRVEPATLAYVTSFLDSWCDSNGIAAESRIVFHRQDQEELLLARQFVCKERRVVENVERATYRDDANERTPLAVLDYLEEVDIDSTEIVYLTSYSAKVLNVWREYSGPLPFEILPISLGTIKKEVFGERDANRASFQRPVRDDHNDVVPPSLDESMEIVRRLIEEGKFDDPVRKSDLRALLTFANSNFRRTVQGQIAEICAEAEHRGLLVQYLDGATQVLQRTGSIPSDARREIDRQELAYGEGQAPTDSVQTIGIKESVPAVDLPRAGSSISRRPQLTRTAEKEPTLQDQIYEYLYKNNLGPFKNQRSDLFDILEREIAAHHNGLPVTKFVTSVINITRRELEAKEVQSVEEGQNSRFPWRYVRMFLFRMLADAQVLVDREQKIVEVSPNNGYAPGKPVPLVAGLVEDWRVRCTAAIFRCLCEAPFGIGWRDLDDVAIIMFKDPYEEREGLDEAVEFLLSNGQLLIDDAGVFRVASQAVSCIDETSNQREFYQ